MDTLPFRRRPLAALVALLPFTLHGGDAIAASVFRWDGDGASNAWSYVQNDPTLPGFRRTNWNTDGIVPSGHVTLDFGGTKQLTSANDLNGLTVQGLSFIAGAGAFTLQGNGIHSAGFISNKSASRQTIALPITLDVDQVWNGGTPGMTITGAVTLGGHALTLQKNVTLDAHAGAFTVGNDVEESLNLADGSAVRFTDGYVGKLSTSIGHLTLGGAGTRVDASNTLFIGDAGVGVLDVESGAQVRSKAGMIGFQAGSEGYATVRGAGSSWTVNGDLTVGEQGTAAMQILDRAVVTSQTGRIGASAGSSGDVVVDGTGSLWRMSSDLEVAGAGRGSLDIRGGAHVEDQVALVANGSVVVRGTGSQWLNGQWLSVRNSTVDVREGGFLDTALAAEVDEGAMVNIDGPGSAWKQRAFVYVGRYTSGSINVRNGGTLFTDALQPSLGYTSDGVGTINVEGPGSQWLSSVAAFVGDAGTGVVNVSAGGTVSGTSAVVGNKSGARGLLDVRGAGSQWTSSDTLDTGGSGRGALRVGQGATVTDKHGRIGHSAGGEGHAFVDGENALWDNKTDLKVGDTGTGTLFVGNGGRVVAGNLVIGAGSEVEVSHGYLNAGTMQVEDGGTLRLNHGDFIEGTQLTTHANARLEYRGSAAIFGTIVHDGHIAPAAPLLGNGGASASNGTPPPAPPAPSLWLGGEISGDGDFAGDIHIGGFYNPGHGIGAIDFHGGNFSVDNGGALQMDIAGAGPGGFDRLFDIHTFRLDGGLLLDFGPDFQTTDRTTLKLFDFDTFEGDFKTNFIFVDGIDADLVDLSSLAFDGTIRIDATNWRPGGAGGRPAPVPLPPALWLLGSSLVGLGSVSRGHGARGMRT